MTDHKPFVFRFGEFEVSEREFLLIKAGDAEPVEPKAFRVLIFLLRNPGRLIKKDEILNAVWDACSVSDNSLTRSIATLRRLLGDDPREPHYIATVQTVGYRFLCPVEVIDGASELSTRDSQPSSTQPEARGQSRWLIAGLAILVLLAAGAWVVRRSLRADPAAGATVPSGTDIPSANMRTVPLTNLPGQVGDPAFSPDAKQIAFIWDGENFGRGDLYVKLVNGDRPLRLTHTLHGIINSPAWSPDGNEIAFGRCDDDGGGVYIVPALGGPEHKVTDVPCPYRMAGYPQWTADGKSIVLQDRCIAGGAMSIVVFSMETGTKRCLTNPPFAQEQGDYVPILSPDQQTVAFLRWPTAGRNDIFTLPLAGGEPHRLSADNKNIDGYMWSADGKSISFSSNRGGLARTWRVSVPGGTIEPDAVYPGIGDLSRDGSKLVLAEPLGASSVIWRADLAGPGGAVTRSRLLLPTNSLDFAPQLSPDGQKITFESLRSGSIEIWKCNADGSDPVRLTSLGGHAGTPGWSPDGKWIAFDFRPAVHSQIFLIDEQGRNLHMLTSEGEYENVVPSWSRDQKFIYFASNRAGKYQIWRREIATARETQVTQNGGFAGFESYDGKTLYFSKFDRAGIWSVPVAGGEEQRLTTPPHVGFWGHFAVTQDGLYFVDSDDPHGAAILFYSFQSHQLTHVLNFNDGFVPVPLTANLSVSLDGRIVLFTQGSFRSSLVLAENLK